MELNIHDKTLKYVGVINNKLPAALHYFDDKWHRYLAEGSSTFEFSVSKNNPDFSLIQESSYISFFYENEDYLFNIIGTKENDKDSLTVSCVNLNLGLLYETLNTYSNSKRHSIVWYLKNAAKITDNVLEIGQNPFPEVDEDASNPILSFDNSETKLARIISICTSFNAEFKFSTHLKDDGTLHSITLDLFKAEGVGQFRKDVTLYYGKNVTGITRTMDKTAIFNATTVTDSKSKYNWLAVEGKHYNSDGQLEFYKNAGENTAYALISRDTFPAQLKSDINDQWVRKDLSIEASSADSLWDYAVSQFKQFAYPQMTYEVSATSTAITDALGDGRLLDIGDTVIIQDDNFDKADGGLILSARVSEQEISFTNPLNNKITFTNFVRLKSDISADLYGRMKDLVDQNTPYRAELETTNGVQFKNGEGSTTLTARIYFGSDSTETVADSYSWTKDDVAVADVQEITVDATGIKEKAVYTYKAMIKDKVVGSSSITITNVNDGAAGKPGTDGRSVTEIEQKYQVTKTSEPPVNTWDDDVWQVVIPQMTSINKYLWSITRTTFNQAPLTQDIVEQKAVYGDSGDNGDPGKIVSDTEPTTKFKGLTWKYIGTTAFDASDGTNIQPNTEYYWNGKNWVINLIKAQNIDVDTISAISENVGDITAGSFTLAKGDTGGVSIKDGLVKSWDISKMTDPNYPDGYSYTSMGVALDSGGLTIYSAGYGITLDKGGVIDPKYKVASLQAIASNGRQNSGTGLILEANDSDFPFTVDGNIDVTGVVTQSSKKATVNFGYGRNVTLTRDGSYVTITSQNRYTIAPANGTWLRNVATLPSGYRPVEDVLIYNHDLSNGSKFSWSLLHPSGVIDLFSSGNITTNDYILSSAQFWITKDELPS
ncbi:phage tail spike protein [Lactococcus lactis]|uniref:phage tail spike protein n=1 Tax=Lactococcus lactis TaxID=1358 RepID=UPI0032E40970